MCRAQNPHNFFLFLFFSHFESTNVASSNQKKRLLAVLYTYAYQEGCCAKRKKYIKNKTNAKRIWINNYCSAIFECYLLSVFAFPQLGKTSFHIVYFSFRKKRTVSARSSRAVWVNSSPARCVAIRPVNVVVGPQALHYSFYHHASRIKDFLTESKKKQEVVI